MNVSKEEKNYLLQIVQDQLRRHAGFELEDLYKMVFQATCGGEHLIKNKAKTKKNLFDEWDNLDKVQKGESLLEVIDPRGEVLRVNLRVYKKIGGNPRQLFDIFVRSARDFRIDRDRLVRYWEFLMEMAKNEEIPFSRDDLEDFLIDVGRKDFPAVHHTKEYVEANQPAYRVVLKRYWEGFDRNGQKRQSGGRL
ncbi:MAG: hypothetical protein ABIL68_02005 [bacterium]